uniref:Uncharacterized protein n=1 Tax=Anguilla anguilla TaxID=7936 RepID=A0A0E9PAQ6_ANGAN
MYSLPFYPFLLAFTEGPFFSAQYCPLLDRNPTVVWETSCNWISIH